MSMILQRTVEGLNTKTKGDKDYANVQSSKETAKRNG